MVNRTDHSFVVTEDCWATYQESEIVNGNMLMKQNKMSFVEYLLKIIERI